MERSRCLPDELIVDEILIKLSMNTLCRFKAISKRWYAAISSNEFAKAHVNSNSKWLFFRQEQNSWLLNYQAYDDDGDDDDDGSPIRKSYTDKDKDRGDPRAIDSLGNDLNAYLNGFVEEDVNLSLLFGSSHGLICFQNHDDDSIFLCNPILRKYRKIPVPYPIQQWDVFMHGFGHVSSTNDFQVVIHLKSDHKDKSFMTYIFSLKNNCWIKIEGDHHDIFQSIAEYTIQVSGSVVEEHLHWCVERYHNDARIISFDLVHHMFAEIRMPKDILSKVRGRRIAPLAQTRVLEIGGCLCLLIYHGMDVELWMLKRYANKSSWMKLYDFYISRHRYCLAELFGFTTNGKFLARCLDLRAHPFHSFLLLLPSP